MQAPECELVDLEDLRGNRAFQWFLWRTMQSWGSDAVMQRIEALQNNLALSDEVRKEQVNQVIVSRRTVMTIMGEIDREIAHRRAVVREGTPDEMSDERRRGDTL